MDKSSQTRLDRNISWIKNNRWLSAFILLGVFIISASAFTDALLRIGDFLTFLNDRSPSLHEPIPDELIPSPDLYADPGLAPLEVSEILYSQQGSRLDVRVRNKSNESIVINHLYLYILFKPSMGAGLEATDTIQTDIADEIDRKRREWSPLYVQRGYRVSYVIRGNEADRYLLDFKIRPEDFASPFDDEPKSMQTAKTEDVENTGQSDRMKSAMLQSGAFSSGNGEYKLVIGFAYNKDQFLFESVSLEDLLKGPGRE